MSKNSVPILNDEPKHKKKSMAKGQPRSKHKHEYKTVLLHSFVPHYEEVEITPPSPYFSHFTESRIKSLESLEDWYCDGFLAKFAYRSKEEFLAEKEIRQENLNV